MSSFTGLTNARQKNWRLSSRYVRDVPIFAPRDHVVLTVVAIFCSRPACVRLSAL